jgi:hypothetical protein
MSITNNKTISSDASIYGGWDPNTSDGGGGDGSLKNPLNQNLDCNNYQVVNASNLLELPITEDLNMGNNAITHIENLKFNDNMVLTSYDGNLLYDGDQVIRTGSADFWLGSYSMGNNNISGVGTVSGATATFSTININNNGSLNFPNSRSIHLIPNGVDLAIGSNNTEIILTSSNYATHISEDSVFNSITLNDNTISFSSYNIALNNGSVVVKDESDTEVGHIPVINNDVLNIASIRFFGNDETENHFLTTSGDMTKLQYMGNDVITANNLNGELTDYVKYQAENDIHLNGHGLYLDNNNIANVAEIGFTSSNLILDVDGSDLQFNGHKIINDNNISSYIEGQSGNLFQKIYSNTYNITYGVGYSTLAIPLNFDDALTGESAPQLCFDVLIKGNLVCIGVVQTTSILAVANEYFDYEVLVRGSGTTWSILKYSDEANNQYQNPSGGLDDINFSPTSTNANEIIMNFSFNNNLSYVLKNTYTVSYVKF